MAEFRDPRRESRDGVWAFVALLLFVTSVFWGLQWVWVSGKPHTMLIHIQKIGMEAVKGAMPVAPGTMNIVEQGFFLALAFVQSQVVVSWAGSWGWAIVLLTVGINLLMLPLRIASIRSGLKMRRIQPDIEAIKARYKGVGLTDLRHNDMTAEIAKLHKDNGVNMVGGCIPLLVQTLLLFAFFGMLRKAIVLHGVGWLWLHDLSAADPLHILPVLMVVFQLLAQWYTPLPGGDARQQKTMTYLMTIVFGYVSWHYASGLALYALTGSMFSIVSQMVIDRSSLGREMRRIRLGDGHK